MDLTTIPKFDSSLFTDKTLASLQAFADKCEAATTPEEIKAAGKILDKKRANHREAARAASARNASLHAYFKRLIHEVPRNEPAEARAKALEETE